MKIIFISQCKIVCARENKASIRAYLLYTTKAYFYTAYGVYESKLNQEPQLKTRR